MSDGAFWFKFVSGVAVPDLGPRDSGAGQANPAGDVPPNQSKKMSVARCVQSLEDGRNMKLEIVGDVNKTVTFEQSPMDVDTAQES